MANREERIMCDCEQYENFTSMEEFIDAIDSLDSLKKASRNQVDTIMLIQALTEYWS